MSGEHESSTETLISALRILSRDIQSPDDVPALTLREAADRLERYDKALRAIEATYNSSGNVAHQECVNRARNAIRPR